MNQKELWIEIDKILWNDWDPIGVNNIASDDEYRGYVYEIKKNLNNNITKIELIELLYYFANDTMGLSTTKEDHYCVAIELLKLINK